MSRAFAWLACLLFSAAWWSVFFSLTAFGILLALSAGRAWGSLDIRATVTP